MTAYHACWPTRIDGEPIGKVNFVLRDSRDRIWITVSTRIRNWMHALRTDLADGYVARYEGGTFHIVADGFHFTNEIRFDAREDSWPWWKPPAGGSPGCAWTSAGTCAIARCSAPRAWARARGRTGSPSTVTAIFGARWSIPTAVRPDARQATCASCWMRVIL